MTSRCNRTDGAVRGRPMVPWRAAVALAASAAAIAAAIGASPLRAAEAFPVKPVRFIVPFAAGGAADVMARTIGAQFSQAWGQTTIVDNRTGAGGLIAAELTARAGADGLR